MNPNRLIARLTTTLLFAAGMIISPVAMAFTPPSLSMPHVFDPNALLQDMMRKPNVNGVSVEIDASASAMNNVGSIWELTDDRQSSKEFTKSSGYAVLQSAGKTRLAFGRFSVYAGQETRSAYTGNNDAGQLWIDYHADSYSREIYNPVIGSTMLSSDWYGIGYACPVRIGKMKVSTNTVLRSVSAQDFSSRYLTGQLTNSGENFSAMMRTISSDTFSPGHGWSLDSQAQCLVNDHLMVQAVAEGIFAGINWDSVNVDDAYVQSLSVFTDPDGYLRDYGGIDGMESTQKCHVRPKGYYRLDMAYMDRTDLMFGMVFPVDVPSSVYLGAAWPTKKDISPYFRYYPSYKSLEIGGIAKGWQFYISGDDFLFASPMHAEIGVSVNALRF